MCACAMHLSLLHAYVVLDIISCLGINISTLPSLVLDKLFWKIDKNSKTKCCLRVLDGTPQKWPCYRGISDTHRTQDTHCGIGRNQPPAGPQHPVPQNTSFFASILISGESLIWKHLWPSPHQVFCYWNPAFESHPSSFEPPTSSDQSNLLKQCWLIDGWCCFQNSFEPPQKESSMYDLTVPAFFTMLGTYLL